MISSDASKMAGRARIFSSNFLQSWSVLRVSPKADDEVVRAVPMVEDWNINAPVRPRTEIAYLFAIFST